MLFHNFKNLLIHFFVVIVQQLDIFLCHILRIDTVEVDRNHGDELKAHELAIHILFCFAAEHQVLSTDTVTSFNVDTRFVRGQHTFLENGIFHALRNHFPAETVWTLMDI